MPNTPQSLVKTKLYRPLVGAGLVHRQRLIDLLDQGCDLPLTLVSAPAGSGKTTLLCDWLATCPCPSAWVSLDEDDGALSEFLSYFVAAVQSVFPDSCQALQPMLHALELPPRQALATLLINEIDSLRDQAALASGKRFVLVLDDYHLVRNQDVDWLIAELVRHPPPTLRLVLASRNDPALPLTVLRARKQVLEIRLQHLRFTTEETGAFLERTLDSPISKEVASSLEEKTEGWVTGLHLASLYLRDAPNPSALLADLEYSGRYVMDYLVDEVLLRQPPELQEFLFRTSVLDRLCSPLCEAVVGSNHSHSNGQAYLEWLEQSNLFIVSLDARRYWFRYHHLFQQLLQSRLKQRLSQAELAELHVRASRWYAENDFVDEAIGHALAAGDEEAAVHLVETHRHQAMNQERWQQLERWLHLMPQRLVIQRPELQLLETWIYQKQWRILDIAPSVVRIESLLKESSLPQADLLRLRGELDALSSIVWYYKLDGEAALAAASRALQELPMRCSNARGVAWMYRAAGFQMQGDITSARSALYEGLKEDRFHGNAFPMRILLAACVLDWISADVSELNQHAAHWLRLAGERNMTESIAWARYFLGCGAYLANDLETAERNFADAVAHQYLAHSFTYSQSAFGLASVYLARGDGGRARALAESMVAYGLEINNTRVLADARAFQAWLALRQGRVAEAQRWAETVEPRAPLVPLSTFLLHHIVLARVLLDQGTPAALDEASGLLTRLAAFAESQHGMRTLAEVLALQALLHHRRGDVPAALAALGQAVRLAQPSALVRVFADLGPELAGLLARLDAEGPLAEYVDHVLQAFSKAGTRTFDGPAQPVQPKPSQADFVVSLTDRELDVLTGLARRQSAKEIAHELVISDRTVKRHTANIYQKLGVNCRRDAVATAAELGLLPQA